MKIFVNRKKYIFYLTIFEGLDYEVSGTFFRDFVPDPPPINPKDRMKLFSIAGDVVVIMRKQ